MRSNVDEPDLCLSSEVISRLAGNCSVANRWRPVQPCSTVTAVWARPLAGTGTGTGTGSHRQCQWL